MPQCSKLISLVILLLALPIVAKGQSVYPDSVGERVKYELTIDFPKAYVSGILIMARVSDERIDASLINEFGISFLDFSYNEKKNKIKLHNVIKQLNKWYIKRLLKSDLKHVIEVMREGGNEYTNKKHKIKYTFSLIDDTEQ